MVMILSNYTKIMEETLAAFGKEKVLGLFGIMICRNRTRAFI